MIGLISAKLLERRRQPSQTQRPRQRPPLRGGTPLGQAADSALVTAVNALCVEVGRLREAMERGGVVGRGGRGRQGMQSGESTSDFVSARGDSEDSDDDQFFDLTNE